jgi:acid phosphatase (class A)
MTAGVARRWAALAALAAALVAGAPAAEPGHASPFGPNAVAQAWAEPYLPADAIDSVALLGPPPAPDSPRGQADRAYYNETRALAGTPRWSQAISDNDLGEGAFHRFSCAVGYLIMPWTAPASFRIMSRIDADTRRAAAPAKARYARVRPLFGNDAPLCLPREPWMSANPSYPSSHAMEGWAWALVLAEIAPDHSDRLLQNGREFGDSRAICGVHFQSDVEAGRLLGAALVARLHSNPAFLRDLAAARREVRAARRAGPPTNCPAA